MKNGDDIEYPAILKQMDKGIDVDVIDAGHLSLRSLHRRPSARPRIRTDRLRMLALHCAKTR